MRIAVLIAGQPRHFENSAWWFKNKVFTNNNNMQVDYYCYFWNDGSPDLESRIVNAYNPVKYQIGDYDSILNEFIGKVQTYNDANPSTLLQIPQYIKENVLFNTNEIPKWGRNFWGQYFASQKITEMTGNLANENYDIIIKTRSDAIFTPMHDKLWLQTFHNMRRNNVFHDKILPSWLYIDSGLINIGDFAFFSLPDAWYNYSKDLEKHCLTLATTNNVLFSELGIPNFEHPAHWVWTKLSLYTKTNWLSFGTVWPTPYAVTLLRDNIDVRTASYKDIEQVFNTTAHLPHQIK